MAQFSLYLQSIKFTNLIISKITKNIEKFQYNVIIANLHEIYNFLNKEIETNINKEILLNNYTKIVKVMLPIIPHIASECLIDIGKEKEFSWPKIEKKYLAEDKIKMVIQIDGKKREILEIQIDMQEKDLINEIKKNIKVKKFLENKEINRVIFVKNKLINLITK